MLSRLEKLLHMLRYLILVVSNMNNARMPVSNELDDKGDTENKMNDSDTEFLAEDESVFSINIIKKKTLVTKVAPYQFLKHQFTFCLPKWKMKAILQFRMNRVPLLPHYILPMSHLFLPINLLPISRLLLPSSVLPISHLLLRLIILPINHVLFLLPDVLPTSYLHILLLVWLLYPERLRNGSKTQ